MSNADTAASSVAETPADTGATSTSGADIAANDSPPTEASPSAEHAETADSLFIHGLADSIAEASMGEMHGYDGHVALALDAGVLPDIGSTLDLLTHSHDLFDVPALDLGAAFHDASGT
jgi:hypothetical protein